MKDKAVKAKSLNGGRAEIESTVSLLKDKAVTVEGRRAKVFIDK